MPTYGFAIAIVAIVVCAYGHDCTKYNLTPSDQSLIDMMKHYLHTSRKADCPLTPIQQDIGVTYVRWGKKTCPGNTDIVYSGQTGGNYYTNNGGGSNWLCLPNDPENGNVSSNSNDGLYGAEYQINSSNNPSGFPTNLYNKEVPCSVCRRKGKFSVLVIAGKKSCYKGWKSEYSGFLISEYKGHTNADFICMDGEAEQLDNRSSNEEGALLYPVRAKCGSLRCPPYKDNTVVLCTVCTK
ncbi:short-chain collagen C4-like [Mytilus trossulus]|uniref:short-chain collagen C4-like n=1 Tax=Mytilus trossulus TaxID=6551 RepID=UPI0030042BBE